MHLVHEAITGVKCEKYCRAGAPPAKGNSASDALALQGQICADKNPTEDLSTKPQKFKLLTAYGCDRLSKTSRNAARAA
jgi:hypothetical protein